MLRSFRIALALLRIPHLALSLFVFPLIISLVLVIIQLLVTGAAVQLASSHTHTAAAMASSESTSHPVHWLLYGSGELRPPLKVCRWISKDGDTNHEVPPNSSCSPDRLDVALHVQNPATFDATTFVSLFNGHVDRLHVCTSCKPDVVITPLSNDKTSSRAYSVFGLSILFLPYTNKDVGEHRVAVRQSLEHVQDALGTISMHIPEIAEAIGISSLRGTVPITANVALLVVIALWLALRAHRKVLDYFSRNDVLLPLAAACGKQTFYSAIWILTLLRVSCFLGASIPIMYLGLTDIISSNVEVAFSFPPLRSTVWLIALVSTLAFATVIASIAELKHRHTLLSISYRFLPLIGAFAGALCWSASFIVPLHSLGVFRLILSAIPVLGITPILVAPITGLPCLPMTIHAVLASCALIWLLRRNARWFAAHLEEV